MKDKLYKHHRKSSYFRMRKLLVFSLVLISLLSIVAIPLGITIAQMHI